MPWREIFVIAVLALQCSNAATINRQAASENSTSDSSNSHVPWNNFFSFLSFYGTSTPSYEDFSGDEYSWQDDCKQEEKSASSETIIIYDVEEQIFPLKNSSHVNGTHLSKMHPSETTVKRKRAVGESKELSEGRHKDVRPYPGYFLGRKLWYVPLWFGIYYSFYLLCLVVKSVARHRIHYPALLPADTTLERKKFRQKNKKIHESARRLADSLKMYNDRYRPYQK